MSTGKQWALAAILVVGGIYVLFIHGHFGGSSAASGSQKTFGTVRLKDTRPGPDGKSTNYATVDFADNMRRNREISVEVLDQGAFDKMEAGKEVNVYYKPEDPSKATLEGGVGMSGVTSPSLRFVAWTALIVGLFFGYQAFVALGKADAGPKRPAPPSPGGEPPAEAPHKPPKIITPRR